MNIRILIWSLFFKLLFANVLLAQDTIVTYIDKFGNETRKGRAFYVRKIVKTQKRNYYVMDYDSVGRLRMAGNFTSRKMKVKQGGFIYYFTDGAVDSKGQYQNNFRSGCWEWYHPNGQLAAKEVYLNGIMQSSVYWDEKGDSLPDTALANCQPSFPGGMKILFKFFNDSIVYPEEALKKLVRGRVILKFTVTEKGTIENIELFQKSSKILDREVLRVAALMPPWNPGRQHNRPVSVSYLLPVTFKFQQ